MYVMCMLDPKVTLYTYYNEIILLAKLTSLAQWESYKAAPFKLAFLIWKQYQKIGPLMLLCLFYKVGKKINVFEPDLRSGSEQNSAHFLFF